MSSCRGNREQALVSPAGANRDNEGVLEGVKGRKGGWGGTQTFLSQHPLLLYSPSAPLPPLHQTPSPLPSPPCPSHAPQFLLPFFPWFHFKQLFSISAAPVALISTTTGPIFSSLSLSLFHHLSICTFLLQSIFASLLKPRPLFHPFIPSSIHPYSTSRWIENKVLKQLSKWKKRHRDKEIKFEGLARAKERRGAGKTGGTFKSILVFVRLYFSAALCLVLLLYYYFSVPLLLNTHSCSGREPSSGRHFRLFSLAQSSLSSSLSLSPPLSSCPGHFAGKTSS